MVCAHTPIFLLLLLTLTINAKAPPTLDNLWDNTAYFKPYTSFALNQQGFESVNAGTKVVVVNHTWYLFGRHDAPPTTNCTQGTISINVRKSIDSGKTWGMMKTIIQPDQVVSCMFADGSAFFDPATMTWHYLVQVLNVGGKGGWMLSHFTFNSTQDPTVGIQVWAPNPNNPVVKGGELFNQICGNGKHCQRGMVDEGTPQIVEKRDDGFYVTFHGYDYVRKKAARGIARTLDFIHWQVNGGELPNDVIFSHEDCSGWNVPWGGVGGCIGSGQASILRTSNYVYEVIEATDMELTCDTDWNEQWWPLGLVRSTGYVASPGWTQMDHLQTPFVGGPKGDEPHVGCSIQYNDLHVDGQGSTYFSFWDVSFHPLNKSTPFQTWHLYSLVWGSGVLPMAWPGPAQIAPPPPLRVPTQKFQFTTSLHGGQIQHNASHFQKVLQFNNELGAVGVRMDLFWHDIQPNGTSTVDESKVHFYRSFYEQASRNGGAGSIVILGGAPSWAIALYKSNATAFFVSWETYLQHAIQIIGNSTVLGWQLWNEMNHVPSGWINGDARSVCKIFSMAGEVIRTSGSNVTRYVNAMADDIVKIDHMIPWEQAVSGWLTCAGDAIDGIGIDHYPGTWSVVKPLDYKNWSPLQMLLTRVNNKSDLWYGKIPAVLETGFSSWSTLVASEQNQARWCNVSLQAVFDVAYDSEHLKNETYRTLSLVNMYQLIDQAKKGGSGVTPPEELHFGVIRSDWSKKEGFGVLAKAMHRLGRGSN